MTTIENNLEPKVFCFHDLIIGDRVLFNIDGIPVFATLEFINYYPEVEKARFCYYPEPNVPKFFECTPRPDAMYWWTFQWYT